MSEVNITSELMYEVLKSIQGTLKEHSVQFQTMNQRLASIEHHMAGIHISVAGHQDEISSIKMRLEQVEKRLELRD